MAKKVWSESITSAAELRHRAEENLSEQKKRKSTSHLTEADALRLVHELEVHQIELEMQNEELVQSRAELENALELYSDLYDFAPVGYFTIAPDGKIEKTNLTGARLLGMERSKLHNYRFGLFVAFDQRPLFSAFLQRVFSTTVEQASCDVSLDRSGAPPLWVHLESAGFAGQSACKVVAFDITARRQVEEQLHKSEAKYRLLAENVQDVIWILDFGTQRFTYISPSIERLRGLTPEAAMLETAQESVTPTSWENLVVAAASREEDFNLGLGKGYTDEVEQRCQDGTTIWVEMTSRFVRNPETGRLELYGITRDITQRKQTEAALRASEEKYRGLLESLDSLVITVDQYGHILFVNDLAARHLGDSAENLIGKTIYTLFSEQVAAALMDHIRQVVQQDHGMVFEHTSPVQGKERWYRTSLQPIHDANGEVVNVLLNANDIDDLKTTQQELQELNRTLEERIQQRTAEVQDLYDNAPAGYHSLDARGNIIRINQTELDWLGYTRSEVLGRPIGDFFTLASQQAFRENYAIFKQRGWVKDLEFDFVRKDGSLLPIVVNAVAIYDEQGNIVMSRSTIFDNTEHKAVEEALHRANLELARAVRMKDEFLANMSHELRTPLNGILGLSEILLDGQRGPLNERQTKYVNTIEASGRHLLSLINDLLDFSKIEAGKFELHPEIVAVSDVCQACLDFVKEQAIQKSILLEFQPETAEFKLWVDQRCLKQILTNLLSNAVKFTQPSGKVTLKVTANPLGKRLEFSICDTGIGIAAADLSRLFTPFTQLDSGLSREQEGTGLGLALVKKLTDIHGGAITVTSEVGLGSCFTVALPWEPGLDLQADPSEFTALLQAHQAQGVDSALNSLSTILLVEDNETNRMMVGDFLESLGYQVLFANNGQEALNQVAAGHPDLILMDLQMPEMDGLEAIRRLRADPRFLSIPIVALTALAMPNDRERSLAAGANEYLSKPVSLKELAELLIRLLRKE
jgi:PAS domain S-box-containing protein